ncbi:unnamed protein product, partial [Mesocestoides corti]
RLIVFKPLLIKKLQESYRGVFAADPWVVDLRKKCPHFYSLGCHLAGLSSSELAAVLSTLENAFQRRIKSLMETALNASRVSVLALTSRLEELEMALFRIGQSERTSLDKWFSRLHERLEPSMVAKQTLELTARSEAVEELARKRSRIDSAQLGERN